MNNLIPSRVATIIFALAIAPFGVRKFYQSLVNDAIVPDYMQAKL